MRHRGVAALFAAFLPFLTFAAQAATPEFRILLDVDNDTASGCTISGMPGVDQVFTTRVTTTDSTAAVTRTVRQTCTSAGFGPVVDVETSGWPAGLQAASGNLTIETRIPFSAFASTSVPASMRIGVEAAQGAAIHTAVVRPDGSPVVYPGVRPGKRRSVGAPGSPRVIVLDGLDSDWSGLQPMFEGIASGGSPSLRMIRVTPFTNNDDDHLYFLFHANVSADAPFATDDTFPRPAGSGLSIPAPGVLENDGDPNGLPLTATPVSPATRGTVTLNPDGSFTYTPTDPASTETDEFEYKASNGNKDSNTARVRITVSSGSNAQPNAVNDAFSGSEDAQLNVPAAGVLQNDTDADSDPLTAALLAPPAHGSVVLDANGGFTYTPNPDYSGSDTFTYTVSDGTDTDTAVVTITIASVNDVPEVDAATFSVAENSAANTVVGTVDVNDVDASDTHTWSITAGNTGNAFSINANTGQIRVATPAALNFEMQPQFTLTVRAEDSGVPSQSDTAIITINVTDANDVATVIDSAATVLEDGSVNVPAPGVLTGATDEDGDTLNASVVTNPAHGTLALNANGSYTYTPSPDYNGTDSFTFRANDGAANSNTATVSITVTAVNDAPSFTAGANVNAGEDSGAFSATAVTAIAAGPADEAGQTVTFNVTNDNNALFSVQPAIAANGTLTFTPAANANGSAILTIVLSDNGGLANGGADTSASQTLTITISAVNDPPTFLVGANQSVAEDAAMQTVNGFATGLSAGPADEAAQTLGFNVTNDNNALFSVQPAIAANGTLTYTPAANANGVATITVTLSDNGGGTNTSAPQTFSITVTPVNDAPVNSIPGAQMAFEDAPLVFSVANGNAITVADIDAAAANVQVELAATNGLVTVTPDPALVIANNGTPTVTITGTVAQVNAALNGVSFTPSASYVGAAQIVVTTSDLGNSGAGGAQTDTDTITINVVAVNDAPSFTSGGDVTVNEDSGAHNAAWASVIAAGPADEAAQTVTFTVTNDNNALFSVQPAISASGMLTFTPAANMFGSAIVTVVLSDDGGTANGGVDTAPAITFTINVTAVNDVPSFTAGANVTVIEDSAAYSAGWATALSIGAGDSGQTLSFNVTNDNNALFTVQPAIAANGTLTFTLAPNANGTANVSVTISDNGGTANGGVDTSAAQNFTLTVTAVNDVPSFTKGADANVLEDSGAFMQAGWATALSAGPADEAAQTLSFNVTNDNNALFAAQPAVDANGQLTFTPAANAFGTATVTISVSDNGGTANGGVDTSATQTFVINITPVNDVPSFTTGGNVTVGEDSAAYSAAWATALDAGPNEGSQTLSFNVTNDDNALFSVQPAIAADGTLTFTLAANANGTATVSVTISDNGGTANGGVDTSAAQNFTLTVTAVNDTPSFTKGADVTVLEDSVAFTEAGWATSLSAGPADEAAQTLSFTLTNDNNALFAVQPAVDANGQLTFTPTANAFGAATVTISVSDNGGTADGGVDTSATQTFVINITGVNDVPSFTAGGNVTVLEDSSAYSAAWASGLDAGAGESGQALSFNVTNNNNALFSVQPAIAADGTLTFTLAANANGNATVSVTISDNGGTANGGVDTSAAQTFTLAVTAVNDAPSFTKGADATVLEDSGAFSQAGWATALSAGPADEAAQTLSFNVTNDNNALFSVQPAVDANGALTFTPALNASGTATVTLSISDNGGTADSGVDTSATQTFVITVTDINDVPEFTAGANVTVLEDSSAYSAAWATGISIGSGDSGQTVSFSVTNDNNSLFSVQPAIAADGTLTFTLAANANGTANVSVKISDNGGTANGGVDTSAAQNFTITITDVNDVPSFTKGADVTALEDSGAFTAAGWATALSAGPADEAAQTLSFNVTNDNNALFAMQPAVDANGQLTFTPAADATGTATVTLSISDNGGTTNSGVDTSATQTFTITLTGVNDEPTFTPGANVTVDEDSGAYSAGWATAINTGAGESGQTASFTVTNDNNALFSVQPAIAADGTLTFTPAADASGTATVDATIGDDGGTADGGDATGATVQFTITVNNVNDTPSFTPGADVSVDEDSSAYSAAWATAISKGAGNESGQTLTFNVTNDNNALFTVQPAIAADGTLTFTPAANQYGSATVTVTLSDDGGGASDTTAPVTFTITLDAINDPPTFTPGSNVSVAEDSAAYSAPWASAMASGPNESSQVVSFSLSNDNNLLFSVQPAIDTNGLLTFTLAPNANGTATVTVVAQDDGGTGNGGDDQAPSVNFTITVSATNDAPSFTAGADVSIDEDHGAYSASGWATGISAGPADESGQGLSMNTVVTNTTGNLAFSQAPSVNVVTGNLTFQANANTCGTATVEITLTDDAGTVGVPADDLNSATHTLTITIACVNDAPSFTKGGDLTIPEDSGAQTVNPWATAISAGLGETDALTFTVTNNNNALFSVQPALNATGALTFTPAANLSGVATVTVTLTDDASTPGVPADDLTSAPQTFTITITEVNDAPTFAAGAAVTVNEDSAAYSAPWATAVDAGAPDESGQTLSFMVTNDLNALFSVQPAIAANGTLTFTPAADAFGTTQVSVTLSDNGGTANGGDDTSTTVQFTLTINGVNDAPTFTPGAAVTVNEDSGAYSAGWASGISAGPNEGGQTLSFGVTNNNNTLFAVQPAIAANGTLTFTPALNQYGVATVTVVLSDNGGTANSGVDTAASVNFTLTINPVNDPPVATTDAFDVLGNTEFRVDLASSTTTPHTTETTSGSRGVSTNDSDPVEGNPFVVTSIVGCGDATAPFDCTVSGQHIVMEADGRFTYTTAPGATSGTFQYVITDDPAGVGSPASATGTVNMTVYEMIWYVNGAAAAGGNGTSKAPYNSFAALNGAGGGGDVDAANAVIFVHNSTVNGQLELESNQRLWGEGYGLAFTQALNGNAPAVTLVAAGTRPVINGAALDTIKVATAGAAEIRGLTLSSTGGNAIDMTTAAALTGASTLTIDGNNFTGAGAETIDVNINAGSTGTRALTLTNNTWTGTHAGNGFDSMVANAGATLNVGFQGNSIVANGHGISMNRSAGTSNVRLLSNMSISGTTAGTGIAIQNTSFDSDISTVATFESVDGGVLAIGDSGNPIGASGMVLVNVQGTLAFTQFNIFNSNGTGLGVTGTGAGLTLSTGAGVSSVTSTGGPAVDLTNVAATLVLTTVQSSASTTTGISLTNVTGTFSTNNSSSITNATGTDFFISGGTANVTYPGTITDDLGQLVSITGSTGGAKLFSGAITDGGDGDGSGISLSGNNGATISFTGGLTLSTGANAAFAASGAGPAATTGGTLNITGTNTITTTTGVALSLTNTTIGASGLTFRSINAGTGASGPANGINLTNTGSGSFTITGAGAAGSGGTIQKATTGIALSSASNISLSYMNINTSSADGINGQNVTNFTLANSSLAGNGTDGDDEGIEFDNLWGTAALTSVTMSGSAHNHVFVSNTSGTLTSLNITGGSYNSNGAGFGNNGIEVDATGTSLISGVTISGATISGNKATGVFLTAADTATFNNAVVDNCVFTNNNIAMDINKSQMSNMTFKIQNNQTITGHNSHAINVFSAAGAGTGGTFQGRVTNNKVGTGAGAGTTGSAIGNCMRFVHQGVSTTGAYVISNNQFFQCPNGRGIDLHAREGTGGAHVTLTGNTISHSLPGDGVATLPNSAIILQANTGNTLRVDVRNNTVPTFTSYDLNDGHYLLSSSNNAFLQVLDNAPTNGTNNAATAQAEVQGANTGTTATNEFNGGTVRLTTTPLTQPPS